MAQQPMTPSKFLHLKQRHSKDSLTQTMTDLSLPESSKKTDERPSPILKGSNAYQSPVTAAQKGKTPSLYSLSVHVRGELDVKFVSSSPVIGYHTKMLLPPRHLSYSFVTHILHHPLSRA